MKICFPFFYWPLPFKGNTNDDEVEKCNIFEDLKKAKRICTKDQKVIKVPNTNVFRIVAPLLVSRGISRIVTEDKLIAL